MIEEGGPPNFGDSYPVVWPETLEAAASDLPAVAVPGHGDVVDERFVRNQLEELSAVARLSAQVTTGKIDVESASAQGPYSREVMRSALARASSTPQTA